MADLKTGLFPRAENTLADDSVFEALSVPAALVGPLKRGRYGGGFGRCRVTRADMIAALLLAVVAVGVRWPFIARGETLLHSDEAIVGLMAQDISEGTRFPIFFYGQRYMGALEAYVVAALLPVTSSPIVALRLAPTLFFAALAAVQYLMLTRWFGRAGGVAGALTLLAAPPALMQWSISARGGYIEVLLWGAVLWWMYGEWFAGGASDQRSVVSDQRKRARRLALFGFVLGSGMWINPSIAVFAAPVLLHALLNRPLTQAREENGTMIQCGLLRLDRTCGGLALPLLAIVSVALLTSVWAVWVDHGIVRHMILLDIFPPRVGGLLIVVAGASGLAYAALRTRLIAWGCRQVSSFAPLILGMLVGLTPTIVYTLRQLGQPAEPTVPLGLRPLWTCGETMAYLWSGLQLLLAADVRPYTDLVCVGRARPDVAIAANYAMVMPALNLLALGAMLSLALLFIVQRRGELATMLHLRAGPHSPASFIALALASVLALYLLGGCSFNFPTIRYLVPLLAILPGIAAAAISGRIESRLPRASGWYALGALLIAWSAGQMAFCTTLGRPHPLHGVADALRARHVSFATAEILDAHLLSYLTGQQPRVAEFEPFWPRLGHYRAGAAQNGSAAYVVHAVDVDWMSDWTRHDWPGPPPPETTRLLWPRLKSVLHERPADVLSRDPLGDGYELWTLRAPLRQSL